MRRYLYSSLIFIIGIGSLCLGGASGCGKGGTSGSSGGGASTGDLTMTPIDWAEAWVNGWTGADRGINAYAHESGGESLFTYWAEDSGSDNQYSNRSDCSFFGSVTLKRSYGWTDSGLVTWLCSGGCPVGRPQAMHYHDAILSEDHFTTITDINSIVRGDLVAIKYYDGATDTGHFMWADGAPSVFCATCSPQEYELVVIDSSDNYHGTADMRYIGTACTTDSDCSANTYATCSSVTQKCSYTGIGQGTLRLLADESGNVVGYSWSTADSSTHYLNSDSPLLRHIAIGRYDGSDGQ